MTDRIPPEHLAEAGVWIARLHGDDRPPELESGFRAWLEADPSHARAFELATEAWEDSLNLRRVLRFAHDNAPPSAPVRRFGPAYVLASVVFVLVIAMGLFVYLRKEAVTTGVGEQRLLTLEDGTRVFLNTRTRLIVDYDRQMRRVNLVGGEALFDVAKRQGRPFVVRAGERQVRALGTSFVVRFDEQQTAVTLVEGKVAVSPVLATSNETSPVVMTSGQRLTFAKRKAPRLDTPTLEQAVAWRRGQVMLDETPLADAVAEMNRYSPTELVVEDPRTASIVINGLFQAGDSASFAEAVAQTYGLSVSYGRASIVIHGAPHPADLAD